MHSEGQLRKGIVLTGVWWWIRVLGGGMLLLSLIGCVRRDVALIPEEGPVVLAEDVKARVMYEKPVGSGRFVTSDNRVVLRAGLTVVRYDWTRKVGDREGSQGDGDARR